MRNRRIFILTPQTLLTRGVERLLSGRPAFQVIGCETDMGRGVENIERLRPDVVIVARGGAAPLSLSEVSSVFQASPGTAVISIGDGENTLHVYREEEMAVADAEDLVRAIRQLPLRPRALRRQEQ